MSKDSSLTRDHLARSLHAKFGFSRSAARKLIDQTVEEIADALVRGEGVKFQNFGTFRARYKRERMGRNPGTGEKTLIEARSFVRFTPSKALVGLITKRRSRIRSSAEGGSTE